MKLKYNMDVFSFGGGGGPTGDPNLGKSLCSNESPQIDIDYDDIRSLKG